jgi:hypothetical protein
MAKYILGEALVELFVQNHQKTLTEYFHSILKFEQRKQKIPTKK